MKCECPKGKKAFIAVYSLSLQLEGQYAEGQCPDALSLVDLLITTSTCGMRLRLQRQVWKKPLGCYLTSLFRLFTDILDNSNELRLEAGW